MLLVNNLLERFRENLDSSKSFDLAVAWATSGKALNALEEAVLERDLKVCAIVGTRGNLTGLEALEKLDEIGELRLVPDDCRMFHTNGYVSSGLRAKGDWEKELSSGGKADQSCDSQEGGKPRSDEVAPRPSGPHHAATKRSTVISRARARACQRS